MDRTLKALIEAAVAAGWTWEQHRRNSHIILKPPDGGPVVVAPSTPSDWRSLLDVRARLRRQGVNV